MWVVWSSILVASEPRRWRSPLYIWCILSESLYIAVVVVAVCMGITQTGEKCYIGLHIQASVLLLAYDWYAPRSLSSSIEPEISPDTVEIGIHSYMNIILTCLFVYPLWKENVISKRLRKMATRTLM